MPTTPFYNRLDVLFQDRSSVDTAMDILRWDREVMMPESGAPRRGRQLGKLAEISHSYITRPEVAEWIAGAETEELDTVQKANLRLMKKAYIHATAQSAEQVRRLAEMQVTCVSKWQEARATNDMNLVSEIFDDLIKLSRDIAAAKGEKLNLSSYDALLDSYAPGFTSDQVTSVFVSLETHLPPLLQKAQKVSSEKKPVSVAQFKLPATDQEKLFRDAIVAAGFDFRTGRLDITKSPPFSGGYAGDTRITTRLTGDEFLFPLLILMHEAGHALYDTGCDPQLTMQPSRNARNMGMAIHESQALLFEKVIGRTKEFWRFAASISGNAWSAEDAHHRTTMVEGGLIRMTSDEISYPLHIILRYHLERDIIDGKISAKDLPEAWNGAMQKLFGTHAGKDLSLGCLQDIHWFDGSFGYFPAYALGHIQAVQMFNTMKKKNPDFLEEIAKGNFQFMGQWLQENIYAPGATLAPPDLMLQATGQKTDSLGYIHYLEERYL